MRPSETQSKPAPRKKPLSLDDLPIVLQADQVAEICQISKSLAYSLMKSEGFPSIRIGQRRLIVPRNAFLDWMEKAAGTQVSV